MLTKNWCSVGWASIQRCWLIPHRGSRQRGLPGCAPWRDADAVLEAAKQELAASGGRRRRRAAAAAAMAQRPRRKRRADPSRWRSHRCPIRNRPLLSLPWWRLPDRRQHPAERARRACCCRTGSRGQPRARAGGRFRRRGPSPPPPPFGGVIVAGVDEVGRGCLFGPVWAAAVILKAEALSIAGVGSPIARLSVPNAARLCCRRFSPIA